MEDVTIDPEIPFGPTEPSPHRATYRDVRWNALYEAYQRRGGKLARFEKAFQQIESLDETPSTKSIWDATINLIESKDGQTLIRHAASLERGNKEKDSRIEELESRCRELTGLREELEKRLGDAEKEAHTAIIALHDLKDVLRRLSQ